MLKENEARYRELFANSEQLNRKFQSHLRNMPMGYMELDRGLVITDWNPFAESIFGFSREEALGKNVIELVVPESERDIVGRVSSGLQEGTGGGHSINKNITRDGRIIICEWFNTPLTALGGNTYGWASMVRDITAQKRAQEELRKSQLQLSVAMDQARMANWEYDVVNNLFTFDDRFYALYGTTAEREGGKFMSPEVYAREFLHPDDVHIVGEEIRKNLETADPEYTSQVEHRIIRRDGEVRHIVVHIAITRDEQGRTIKAHGVNQDITERKKMEEELRAARDAAEAATRAKSEFLANMSHEIRTPMNAIVGLAHLLQKTPLSARQIDYLEKIQSSSFNLLGIINDILDLSKIEAGKLEIEISDFHLDHVIANVSNVVSHRVAEKGLEIYFRTAPEVPLELVGDSLRLGQVLVNLVGNAVKFTERGAIVVSTTLEACAENGVRLRFSIRDTGIGMSREQRERLFRPFEQADTSMTRRYGGTGLGLAISRQLVELMGGGMYAESEPGKGSEFYFTVLLGTQPESGVRAFKIPLDLRDMRVLLADDNATAREIMSEMLVPMTFKVTAVSSGMAVLREMENSRHPYGLVLLDWSMPGMEAGETIRNIKSFHSAPKVIVVTSYGREEVLRRAGQMEIDGFLVKPLTESILFDAIMDAFGHEGVAPAGGVRAGTVKPPVSLFGARVLLVEDNKINQQVALELLRGFGLDVDIAENGREALDAAAANACRYDAVLMDLQMPVMDGYEAARRIRAEAACSSLPIIALTAHALHTERQKCLDAGMNDYVSKPVDPVRLFEALVRWIRPWESVPEALKAAEPPGNAVREAEPESDPDIPGVDARAAIQRLDGNRKLYKNLLKVYAKEYADVVKQVREALDASDVREARRLAHSIKGSSGNLSITGVYGAARDLEAALAEGGGAPAEGLLERVDAELRPVLEALSPFVTASIPDTGERVVATPPDMESLRSLFAELEFLLGKNSMAAVDRFDALKAVLAGGKYAEMVRRIDDCMERLDFKGARERLMELEVMAGVKAA